MNTPVLRTCKHFLSLPRRLFTYTTYGNKILQPLVALCLLYYTWLQVELKRTSVESYAKKNFPVFVVAILFAELILAIWDG